MFCLAAHLVRSHGRLACAFWHSYAQQHGPKALPLKRREPSDKAETLILLGPLLADVE